MEDLANALGLNLQLESHAGGVVRGDESESEHGGRVDLDIEGSSSREHLQQLQPDGLNSFARQLEEQLSSCHREKPLDLEPSDPEVDYNEVANLHAEKAFESKEITTIEYEQHLLKRIRLNKKNTCKE